MKVIQISTIPDTEQNYGTIYVLYDNGEVWRQRHTEESTWIRVHLPLDEQVAP